MLDGPMHTTPTTILQRQFLNDYQLPAVVSGVSSSRCRHPGQFVGSVLNFWSLTSISKFFDSYIPVFCFPPVVSSTFGGWGVIVMWLGLIDVARFQSGLV